MLNFLQNSTNLNLDKILDTGEFTMTACVYNVIGNSYYKFKPGCFDAFIASGQKPAMLWGHNSYTVPIGVYTNIYTDKKALFVDGKLNLDDEQAIKIAKQAVFAAKNGGKPMGASVGLSSSQREIVKKVDEKAQEITIEDTDIGEISLCSVPAIRGAQINFSQAVKELGFDFAPVFDIKNAMKMFMLDNKQDFQITIRSLEAMARDVLGLSEREAKELAFALKEQDPNLFYKPRDVAKTAEELLIEMFAV